MVDGLKVDGLKVDGLKVEVVSVAPLIGEAIRRIARRESTSDLFHSGQPTLAAGCEAELTPPIRRTGWSRS